MNYYERHLGDYSKDTAHLTMLEDGAYLLLIMDYWTNGPLPDDDAALARGSFSTDASNHFQTHG